MDENRQTRGHSVSAVAYLDNARGWARRLEEAEAERAGLERVEDARSIVARRTGVPEGTLRSLRKNRLKSISAYAYDKLNRAAAHLLERQLARLTHELHLTRQQGLDPRSNAVAAVEQDIARVRASLGLTPDSSDRGGG